MSEASQEEVSDLADAIQDCRISAEDLARQIELHNIIPDKLPIVWPKPRVKPPTIFLHKSVDFAQHCKDLLRIGVNFYQPYLGLNYTRIICLGFNDHKVMRHYFERHNLPYHTFSHPYNKKVKVVIRGFHKDIDLDNVQKALTAAGIPVEKVYKMKLKDFVKDKDILVLAVVPCNEESKNILRLKKAFGHDVQIEAPKKKSKQCYRCQKWGHTQRYCHGEVKCVKCAGDHMYTECTRKPEDEPPTCVNCGGNHTSSYRQCHYCPDSSEYKRYKRCSKKIEQFQAAPVQKPREKRVLITLENCEQLYKTVKNISKHKVAPL